MEKEETVTLYYKVRLYLSMRRFTTTLFIFLIVTLASLAQTIEVHGTVLDEKDNEPLIGVVVSVSNDSTFARTDIDGKYQMNANVGDTLIFRYLTQYYKVKREVVSGEECSVKLVERITESDPIPLGFPAHLHLLNRIHVKGYIMDQITKEPIDNVKVSRKRYDGEYQLIQKEDGQWAKVDSGNIDTFSDDDGYYFTRCYPDDYLEFSHSEYKTRYIQIEETACDVVMERK